jgi:uncharacterized protein (TIGR02246 family)
MAGTLERASIGIRQEQAGAHAGEVETSMMLYIDPGAVDMRRAVRESTPTSTSLLRFTRRRGGPGIFSESGVWGDPTLATPEKGRVIVEALVAAILADIEAMRRATPPPATAANTPAARPGPAAGALLGPVGPGGCTAGDERVIRAFGDAFTLHWTNGDAAQLAALWALDGDVVHPDGVTERGREVIRANRAALFLRREYRASRHPITIGNIRCLSADVAVADGKWELRGVTDPAGVSLPAYEGLLTLVMNRAAGGWSIAAYRYTQKPGGAAGPALLKRPGFTDRPQ